VRKMMNPSGKWGMAGLSKGSLCIFLDVSNKDLPLYCTLPSKPPFYLIFAIFLVGCNGLQDPISIVQRPSSLVIFNNTADTVNFTMMENKAAQYTHWKPCDHPRLCSDRGIKPGLSRDMPYRLIHNWYPGAEVAVYWWTLVPDSAAENGYRVDGPYKKVVPTPGKAKYAYELESWLEFSP